MSIYEVHLGLMAARARRGEIVRLSYREIAEPLADYVIEMGFTHVEFLPLTEHPFFGSWGYQIDRILRSDQPVRHAPGSDVSDRSPSSTRYRRDSRLGSVALPDRRMGLGFFDGTHLYEHSDPRKGFTRTGTATSSITDVTRSVVSC